MIDFIVRMYHFFREEPIDNELLQYVKREYPRDWEHAYHMMINGKMPYSGL
jgi:hypothetical protein